MFFSPLVFIRNNANAVLYSCSTGHIDNGDGTCTANLISPVLDQSVRDYVDMMYMHHYSRIDDDFLIFGNGISAGFTSIYFVSFVEWDLSSISDNSKIINSNFLYESIVDDDSINTQLSRITLRPSLVADEDLSVLFSNIKSGTTYISSWNPPVGQSLITDLGSLADNDIQNSLVNNWFALGLSYGAPGFDMVNNDSIYSSNYASAVPVPTLQITYEPYTLYQITNLNSEFDALNNLDKNIEISSAYGLNGVNDVFIKSGNFIISKIEDVNFISDLDWSELSAGINADSKKSFLSRGSGLEGSTSFFNLYVPRNEGDKYVRICPGVESLDEITTSCTNGFALEEGQKKGVVQASITEINDVNYWVISGLYGTGGMSLAYLSETGSNLNGIIILSSLVTLFVGIVVLKRIKIIKMV